MENSSLEKELIWSYVKTLRIEYLLKNTELTCEKTSDKFISLEYISTHFDKLSKMVGVISSKEMTWNLSRSDIINTGSEMFMVLNSCPSFYVKLYWKAIYGNESRMAKFATNIIQKANNDFKVRAQKIFAKISSVLEFHSPFYHHEGNASFGLNMTKDMSDIKGK